MASRARAAWVVLAVFGAGSLLRVALLVAYRPAFLGIPDSGTYIDAARGDLLGDPVHPAGYAFFLRVLHALPGGLNTVAAVQHALGILAALIVFRLALKARNQTWVGLVPAGVVLFNGLQVWSEHAPLSDPLFTVLVAAALLCAVEARNGRVWQLLLLGVLVAAATLVRTVGLVLVPLVVAWLVAGPRMEMWRRTASAAVVLACTLVPLGGYVALQQHRSGVLGFTQGDGRITYAVAAPFADCSRFSPPSGTRGLCQSIPAAHRQSVNAYLWGFPDRPTGLGAVKRASVSPAWRLFGPMPNGNGPLAAFGREAILSQPLDYLGQVLANFSSYWRDGPGPFVSAAARPDPNVQRASGAYYSQRQVGRSGFGVLSWYGHHLELTGALIVILLVVSVAPLAAPRAQGRGIAVLCGAAGWLLLGGSALITTDPRYALPALGPLAVAGSIGMADLVPRLVSTVRRRSQAWATKFTRTAA